MGEKVVLARVRKHGLKVVCSICGEQERHFFNERLRERRSACCFARLVPAWHVARLPDGDFRHPKLAARYFALRETEIAQQRLF